MKESPIVFSPEMVRAILEGRKTQTRRVIKKPEQYEEIRDCAFCCPYGQVGDRLWVKETWGAWPHLGGDYQRESLRYRADGEYESEYNAWRWRPSIFMPRWASRLTLEIIKVRVQRLQEISAEDVVAEGVLPPNPHGWLPDIARLKFGLFWDTLNAKRGYDWASNSWVWAIEFQRMT